MATDLSIVLSQIAAQMEFYFSDIHIQTSKYFKGLLEKQPDRQTIPLAEFLRFNRISTFLGQMPILVANFKTECEQQNKDQSKVLKPVDFPATNYPASLVASLGWLGTAIQTFSTILKLSPDNGGVLRVDPYSHSLGTSSKFSLYIENIPARLPTDPPPPTDFLSPRLTVHKHTPVPQMFTSTILDALKVTFKASNVQLVSLPNFTTHPARDFRGYGTLDFKTEKDMMAALEKTWYLSDMWKNIQTTKSGDKPKLELNPEIFSQKGNSHALLFISPDGKISSPKLCPISIPPHLTTFRLLPFYQYKDAFSHHKDIATFASKQLYSSLKTGSATTTFDLKLSANSTHKKSNKITKHNNASDASSRGEVEMTFFIAGLQFPTIDPDMVSIVELSIPPTVSNSEFERFARTLGPIIACRLDHDSNQGFIYFSHGSVAQNAIDIINNRRPVSCNGVRITARLVEIHEFLAIRHSHFRDDAPTSKARQQLQHSQFRGKTSTPQRKRSGKRGTRGGRRGGRGGRGGYSKGKKGYKNETKNVARASASARSKRNRDD